MSIGSCSCNTIKLLVFFRNGFLPQRPSYWPLDNEQHVIAICLVIVDTLPHEEIWKEWVNCKPSTYDARFFIHAKHPERIQSSWIREHLIDCSFRPEWNSIEVVQAMLAVLDRAMLFTSVDSNTPNCGRFVFGTESCLPIYSIEETGQRLYQQDCSWLNAYRVPRSGWEAGCCFGAVDSTIVPREVKK